MHLSQTLADLLLDMQSQAALAEGKGHWERARSLHPDSARLLHIVARAMGARRILEIGTSVGCSTVFLALAAQATGGHVSTLELMPAKFEAAQANLARAGLSPFVTQHLGDALELLPALPGPWDLVFVDAEKDLYEAVWPLIKDTVRPGGLVVSDNVVSHASDLAPFLDTVRTDADYDTVTVPLGLGLEFSSRRL
jgi:predicted O-methyltransferase YrrM